MKKRITVGAALDELYRVLVIRPVLQYQSWRCGRAKAYLLRHDDDYRSGYAGEEIVRRRNKLYDNGVSPNDPSIPDLWSMEDEMPKRAWPRKKSILDI